MKWGSIVSRFIGLMSGIRQGGVLSPQFFAIYIDSVVKKVSESNIGCYMKYFCMSILLYADDILLLAPSVTSLQQILLLCEQELAWLDMPLNVKKSACMRVGGRFNVQCANIVTSKGRELSWVNIIRYLGIYIESASSFKCSLDAAKRSFYRSFNAVFGKVGRIASHEVIIQLVKTKCFPVLYYGLEACPLRKSQYNSIDYVINSSFRKIFDTRSQEIIDVCLGMFNCLPAQQVIAIRKRIFLKKFSSTDNVLCRVCTDSAAKELSSLL